MAKIDLIIQRYTQDLQNLKNDKYHVEHLIEILKDILQKIAQRQTGKEADKILHQKIIEALKIISEVVGKLSVRRGMLMARNHQVPWKMLTGMSAILHKLEQNSSAVLEIALESIIAAGEFNKLIKDFNGFYDDVVQRITQCNEDKEILEKRRDNLLVEFKKIKRELEQNYKSAYRELITIVQALKNILANIRTADPERIQGRLTELEKLAETLRNHPDPFVKNFLASWEKDIGYKFNPENIGQFAKAVNQKEEPLRAECIYITKIIELLETEIRKIETLDKLAPPALYQTINKICQLLSKKKIEDIGNAIASCYQLWLNCKEYGRHDKEIYDLLNSLYPYESDQHAEILKKFQDYLDQLDPLPKQKQALLNLKQYIFGKDNNPDWLVSKLIKQKPEAIKKALASQLNNLASLLVKPGPLSDIIAKVHDLFKEIYEASQPVDMLGKYIPQLDELFKKAEHFQKLENTTAEKANIPDETNEETETINAHFKKIIIEEKQEDELTIDQDFLPILMRLLTPTFDNNNLLTCIKLIKSNDELRSIIDQPISKLILLQILIVLGESTKDVSNHLKTANTDIPWHIYRIIRNDIFHTLIDTKLGRNFLWKFVQEKLPQFDKKFILNCLEELRELGTYLDKLEKSNAFAEWNDYPEYQAVAAKQSSVPQNQIRDNMLALLRKNDEEDKHSVSVRKDKFPFLQFFLQTLQDLADKAKLIKEKEKSVTNIKEQEKILLESALDNRDGLIQGIGYFNRFKTNITDNNLAIANQMYISFCGEVIKQLKDKSEFFESLAPAYLLQIMEDIILLRGELAHSIMLKDTKVKEKDIQKIELVIVPLINAICWQLDIKTYPVLMNYEDELKRLEKQFDNTLGSAIFHITEAEKEINNDGDSLRKNHVNDMAYIKTLYEAINYYETEHKTNLEKLNEIIEKIISLPTQCKQNHLMLTKHLEALKNTMRDTEKFISSVGADSQILVMFNEQDQLVKEAIEVLEKKIASENKAIEKSPDVLLQQLKKKLAAPDISKLKSKLESSFPEELTAIKTIVDKLRVTRKEKSTCNEEIVLENFKKLREKINTLFPQFLKAEPVDIAIEFNKFQIKNREIIIKQYQQELKLANAEFDKLDQQYQDLYTTYNNLFKDISKFDEDNEKCFLVGQDKKTKDIKPPSKSVGKIAKEYDSSIKELKGTLRNSLEQLKQKMDELSNDIAKLNLVNEQLSYHLKASAEPQDPNKDNNAPGFTAKVDMAESGKHTDTLPSLRPDNLTGKAVEFEPEILQASSEGEKTHEMDEVELAMYINIQDNLEYEANKEKYLMLLSNAFAVKDSSQAASIVDAIKQCITEDNRLINVGGPHGFTALHLAGYLDSTDLAKFLFNHNADFSKRNKAKEFAYEVKRIGGKQTAELIYDFYQRQRLEKQKQSEILRNFVTAETWQEDEEALRRGIEASIEQFNNDHDFEALSLKFSDALHDSTVSGKVEAFKAIIKLIKLDDRLINKKGKFEQTALHAAVYHNQVEVAQFLLDKGADVTLEDKNHDLPHEVSQAHKDAAKLVEDAYKLKKPSSTPSISSKMTVSFNITPKLSTSVSTLDLKKPVFIQAVINAMANHDTTEVKQLLKENKNIINQTDEYGETALHHAATKGNKAMVLFLLENGADITIKNQFHHTAAEVAKEGSGCQKMIESYKSIPATVPLSESHNQPTLTSQFTASALKAKSKEETFDKKQNLDETNKMQQNNPVVIHSNPQVISHVSRDTHAFFKRPERTAYPSLLNNFGVRKDNVTGPAVAKALEEIEKSHSKTIALEVANRFCQWAKYHNRNFNMQDIYNFINAKEEGQKLKPQNN